MSLPIVLPNDDGIRPAGKPDECFYCQQKVGKEHKYNCVILSKKVTVRYSYEIEIEVAHAWDENMIEFHRNDSSWCADNSIDELEKYTKDGCLCHVFSCEVLSMPNVKPYRRNDHDEIVP